MSLSSGFLCNGFMRLVTLASVTLRMTACKISGSFIFCCLKMSLKGLCEWHDKMCVREQYLPVTCVECHLAGCHFKKIPLFPAKHDEYFKPSCTEIMNKTSFNKSGGPKPRQWFLTAGSHNSVTQQMLTGQRVSHVWQVVTCMWFHPKISSTKRIFKTKLFVSTH